MKTLSLATTAIAMLALAACSRDNPDQLNAADTNAAAVEDNLNTLSEDAANVAQESLALENQAAQLEQEARAAEEAAGAQTPADENIAGM